jgi:hypothetical protein
MNTYEEVADKEKLDPFTKEVFVRYMRTRWPSPEDEAIKCQVGYADEWAGRFRAHREFECSDSEGRAILKMISKEMLDNDEPME